MRIHSRAVLAVVTASVLAAGGLYLIIAGSGEGPGAGVPRAQPVAGQAKATTGEATPPATATTSAASPSPSTIQASASASAGASAPARQAARGGWVKVDQALWKKQLAAFKALKPAPVRNNPVKVPEFHVDCTVAKQSPDDAIVFPNLPGASHMHTFFGPDIIGASTTTKDLLAAEKTSCRTKGDNSAYWMPQLTRNGKPVPPHGFRIYYGSRLKDPSRTTILPPGLVMIAGDAKRQEPTPKDSGINQFWCAGAAEVGRSADGNWPKCGTGGRMIISITFPDCWDGKHVDSPDHRSHVGPAGPDGTCAGGRFPVAIPSISELFTYDTRGGDGFALSSGLPSSAHMDMMNGWDPAVLGPLVRTCINQGVKCGTTPTFD
ncbi:hypothetical protein ACTI_64990 [Actinoplanes sp. OR16]|uniref:DUF1996 domain-containing protein n=1 Tax=Actinoplanes sp. OR16 TaxID=946334 RepID=UPI000F6C040F|nr:DUF1996 domain-containing protein [Actinoplanes sp. OR16]BBH69814.1 hypothetical protein ACTI_64990 [Actinoplanes sp. OR16]